MKKKNGYSIVELIVLLAIVGAAMLLVIGKLSYAFVDNSEEFYQNKLDYILEKAEDYGEIIKERIQEEQEVIVSVNELITNKVIGANEDGKITDPRDENKDLNDRQISLKIVDDEVKGTYVN